MANCMLNFELTLTLNELEADFLLDLLKNITISENNEKEKQIREQIIRVMDYSLSDLSKYDI